MMAIITSEDQRNG